MTPLIVDTDPGVDDAFALAVAALAPEVDLRAVTTVHGNVGVEQTTENARRLARFKYAMDRVIKIAAGTPRLTDEELAELADVLLSRTRERAA